MREGLRGAGRRKPAWGDRHPRAGAPGTLTRECRSCATPRRGEARRRGAHLIQRAARARAILIAGAIAVAVLALASPATARTAAPAYRNLLRDQNLLHGSFGDVTVTPGHWCAIGFSTVTGNIDVTGATSFFLYASAVGGNVTITGTTSHPNAAIGPGFGRGRAICADAIYGNLTIYGGSPASPVEHRRHRLPAVRQHLELPVPDLRGQHRPVR